MCVLEKLGGGRVWVEVGGWWWGGKSAGLSYVNKMIY